MVTFAEAGQALERVTSRGVRCAVVVALLSCACSRRSSELEQTPPARTSPAASVRATAPLAAVPPSTPPVTPKVPPELVACGERDFYRITAGSLQAFEIATELPPPHIRGSRVARQVTDVPLAEPASVVVPVPRQALVRAKQGVFRYELGQKQARQVARGVEELSERERRLFAVAAAAPGEAALPASSVAGVLIDRASDGDKVAVLSVALDGQSYRPTVTIFSGKKELGRLSIGPSVARTQPELDLCLIPGRPWVVVGGTRWLQLLDWESRRLLAEW
jgi:hypothetical protein